jgi:hypothetical protein
MRMRRTLPSLLFAALGLSTCCIPSLAAPAPWRAEAEVDLAEGLSALASGDVAAAISWLSKAAALRPDEGTRRGLELLRLGRTREAAAEIEASLVARHAPEAVDDRGPWEGTVGLSAAADSNPNLLSNNLSVAVPGSGDKVVRGGDADGLGGVDLRLALYPFHAREGPSLGVTLETGRAFHLDFRYLDLGEARGTVHLALGSDPQGILEGPLGFARTAIGGGSRFTALLQAGGAVYRLSSEPYYQTLEAAAAFGVRETPAIATRVDLAYADRRFPGGLFSDPERSGRDLSLGLSQSFELGAWNRWLRLGARGVDRRAGPEFTGTFLEGNGELAWPLALRWSAFLDGRAREDRYDRPESNLFDPAGPRRRDSTLQAAATVVWAATHRLRWTARTSYTRRRSNVELGDGLPDLGYRRLVVTAGLSWEL